ncbi:MAG: ECF transporter S component [Oscillospiraceae bacterium]|nr:ECF transporter S component [Oscillospiraceae bacterium]
MKHHSFGTREMVTLAMLCAILLIMSFTPLGYLNIGPLAISLNMIPVGIGAMALGPVGGMVLGGMFGITSFLQCMGIGGTSAMGVILFEINPFLAFVQRFVPRLLAGLVSGYLYIVIKKLLGSTTAGFVTGFCAALLNTVLFMLALVLLFGNTEYMQDLIGGKNVILFICGFVGINAVVEMIAATAAVGVIGRVLNQVVLSRR